MSKKKKLLLGIFYSLRPFQWVKNLAVFAAIIFNGQLFNSQLFNRTFLAFIAFCLFSSASYLINDVIDAPYDRHHPLKRNRPIARGEVNPQTAETVALILAFLGFILYAAFRFSIALLYSCLL